MHSDQFWKVLQTTSPPFVLIRIEKVKGSSPREKGAKMMVSAESSFGTIGGGRMEHMAMNRAHDLLSDTSTRLENIIETETHNLIPRFDQCCGGKVQLSYEVVTETTAWFDDLKNLNSQQWQTHSIGLLKSDNPKSRSLVSLDQIKTQRSSQRVDFELLKSQKPSIYIFGAGHVSRALIYHLVPLEIDIHCFDSRTEQLNLIEQRAVKKITFNKNTLHDDISEHIHVNGMFIVMTHSHQLDYELCKMLLSDYSPAFLGVIGSQAKTKRFRNQFQKEALQDNALDCFYSPIGDPRLEGKSPHIIALSVAKQLLEQLQNQQSQQAQVLKEITQHV